MTTEKAKEVLRKEGYYVGNLWVTADVIWCGERRIDCTEEEAQIILNNALTDENTMVQIWTAIQFYTEELLNTDEQSDCCGADRWNDTDICNECREHADFENN